MELAAKMLPGIGSQMHDPKGTLLDARQRTERAGHLFATSLALAMVENGWELHAQPGSFLLVRDKKQVNVIAKAEELFSGRMSAADWEKLCADGSGNQRTIADVGAGAGCAGQRAVSKDVAEASARSDSV